MSETYKHWRDCTDLSYLRAECFRPNEEKILTIIDVKAEKLENKKNGTIDEKPVLYFKETELKLALNVVNCETIEKIYHTGNIYEWIGKKVQLYATKTRVGKEMVPCIRIRDFEPVLKCCMCGKEIEESIYYGSIERYGKPYCGKECLAAAEKQDKGKEIL